MRTLLTIKFVRAQSSHVSVEGQAWFNVVDKSRVYDDGRHHIFGHLLGAQTGSVFHRESTSLARRVNSLVRLCVDMPYVVMYLVHRAATRTLLRQRQAYLTSLNRSA